ncbi:CHAP domain-containing protein [Chakrabartia godavariana]|nr:CHAP domain-containing protein [Chakrabartia godavariana]
MGNINLERRKALLALGGVALAGLAAPAFALPVEDGVSDDPYWQCVPIARTMSGIQIYGDAHTWWDQAEGRYRKGSEPKKGAVLNFMPHGGMKLGHVAAVTKIIDDRTILVTHANWSPYGGRRGYVEKNVRVIDVSEDNDWSRVRVWFAPIGNMGGNEWPTFGFIYPNGRPPMALPETAMELPKQPPQLRYAVREDPEEDIRPTSRMLDIRKALFEPAPTGRLAYLDRTLKRLK